MTDKLLKLFHTMKRRNAHFKFKEPSSSIICKRKLKENVCVNIMEYFTARFGGKSSKRFACNMKCQASARVTVSSRMTGDQLI